MADTQFAHMTVTLQDFKATLQTVRLYFLTDPAVLIGTIMGDMHSFALNIDGMAGARVVKVTVALNDLTGGFKASAVTSGGVEQGLLLNLANSVTQNKYGLFVPGYANANIVAGKPNLAETNTAALISALASGFGDGVFTTPWQAPTAALIDARVAFRKRRSSLERTSFSE